MVIMDYVDGDTLVKGGEMDKETVRIIKTANKVRLINFDWTGEEGKAEYPYLMSRGMIG